MAERLKGIDLTLESVFAGQENFSLLFDSQQRYHRQNAVSDNREVIFSESPMSSSFLFAVGPDETFFPHKSDDYEITLSVNHAKDIFGNYPRWFNKLMPFSGEEYDLDCHRCGVNINVLNSDGYGLCADCDDSLELKTIF